MATQKKTILLSSLSTCIEWIEFTLYIYLSPYISKLFFPHTSKYNGLLLTFAVFAAGYAVRPFGGIFFGSLGDRIGRRKIIILTTSCMSFSILIMSVMPTFAAIGVYAWIPLLFARSLQGFSVGGEYSGVLVMLAEQATDNNRGRIAAIGTSVSGFGILISASMVTLFFTLFTNEQMLAWVWRLPYIITFVLSLITIILQLKMLESPYFESLNRHSKRSKKPMRESIEKHRYGIFVVFCLSGYFGIVFYVVVAFLPSYLTTVLNVKHQLVLWITMLTSAIYSFTALLWGSLSDKFGRKPLLISSALGLLILTHPIFILFSSKNTTSLVIGTGVMMLFVTCGVATLVSTINEFFPTQHRNSGVSLPYNLSNAILGGTVPLVCTYLVKLTNNPVSPCYYVILSSALILILMFTMPETRKKAFK